MIFEAKSSSLVPPPPPPRSGFWFEVQNRVGVPVARQACCCIGVDSIKEADGSFHFPYKIGTCWVPRLATCAVVRVLT